ncbi:MAG: DUF47 family protein, partial [Gammaproteobacteria bacterium]|nr:DUF47 family protein [Gammaproteobacteria bacterium]
LVMDLHKALNALQAALAVESIDGAMVYGLEAGDRALVAAFMRGLNATAPLKFDHPGLGTTATRSGGGLVIQNDIGTTDAHVVVVRVTGNDVMLTYTDVHHRRLTFFQRLFEQWDVAWETPRTRHSDALAEGASFYGTVGRFTGADVDRTEAYLEFLGSRLVFLIDWNRARKRLRSLVKNRDAVAVLRWAADAGAGHRAFLELGGEQLVRSAIEQALPDRSQYGRTLYDILEPEAAVAFLQFTLRCASEGLREGRSSRSVRDELRTELLEHVTSVEQSYLALLADHAALIAELACGVRDGLARAGTDAAGDYLARAARRAKCWESQADQIVLRVREMDGRVATEDRYGDLCHTLDEAADELEDAAHLLTMMPDVARLDAVEWPLSQLAEKVVVGAHTLVSALECMAQVRHGGPRQDMHDFLAAVDRLEAVEHDTDELERKITSILVSAAAEAGQLHLYSLFTHRLETAVDWMERSGWKLRERVLR